MTGFGQAANQGFRDRSGNGSGRPVRQGFRFGRFELDVHARELLKDGVRMRLQDQPYEVLVMLLRQPGEVLTRDELRRQLWAEGTFVDFEHGLNAAVKRLRTVLGDSADNPQFVETLHRRGYRFIADVEGIGSDAVDRGAAAHRAATERQDLAGRKPRLAVLPFADLGDKSTHAYFSEGLTEEMITQLGRMCTNRLGVVARTSSTLVLRHASTAQEIGQALRVDYLVEGSVRRDGDRVRVTAQLVETRGETQLWAQSYDRHLADCFLVQTEVANEIVHSLAMELLPDTHAGGGTRDVAAHQAYLKGRYHWNRTGSSGLLEAVAFFEKARALDPDFAAAHAALGRAEIASADYYLRAPREALEAGRRAAVRALELDPTDPDAHVTLAEVRKNVDWNWDGAEASYRSALATNPSHEGALRYFGLFLAARGRAQEAAAVIARSRDLDPMCLSVNTGVAWVDYLSHDYERAIETCRHTLDMDDQFVPAYRVLAASLAQIGLCDEAVAALERTMDGQDDPVSMAWLAHLLGRQGGRTRAIALVEGLEGTEHGSPQRYVSKYHLAVALTGIGDLDRAVSSLAAACEARDPAIVNIGAEPRFEPLRSHVGYRALVKRLALQ